MALPFSTSVQQPQVSVPVYDPNDPNYIVTPGSGYDGVVNITDGNYTGSGVLLETGRHILTAAHVVDDMSYFSIDVNADFVGGRQTFDVSSVTLHSDWSDSCGYDLAILELDETLPAAGFALYEGNQEIGSEFILVGYEVQGTGITGQISPDYSVGETKRIGHNVWEAFGVDLESAGFSPMGDAPDRSLLFSDFDSGYASNDALGYYLGIHDLGLGSHEVTSTVGDSGGPLFLDVDGELQVAGIVNGGRSTSASLDMTPGVDSSYGELSYDARVSYYADWIYSVIGEPVPGDDVSPDDVITDGNGAPSILYLGEGISQIVVTDDFVLRPQPGIIYGSLDIIMHSPGASVEMSASLASSATLSLHPDGSYAFSVNASTGMLDITRDDGGLVASLPISGDTLTTPPVRIGEHGTAGAIAVDPDTFDIVPGSLPDTSGGSNFNVVEASQGVAEQLLHGTDGQADFFVFDIESDANGAFANFGQAVVDTYRQADGDQIVFVDQENQWNSVSQMVVSGISPDSSGAIIRFNEDPNITLNEQSLQILGAEKDNVFGDSLDTLEGGVDFSVATAQGVAAAGGLDDYLGALVA